MPSTTPAPPELKFTPLDFKAVAADGAFEGYASLFNKEDLGHDIVAPGAFRDSLADRGPTGVKMLFQHNPSEPIGIWDSLREDARGLFARGRLTAGGAPPPRGPRPDPRRCAGRPLHRLPRAEGPPRRQDRRAPPGESRSLGDLR